MTIVNHRAGMFKKQTKNGVILLLLSVSNWPFAESSSLAISDHTSEGGGRKLSTERSLTSLDIMT